MFKNAISLWSYKQTNFHEFLPKFASVPCSALDEIQQEPENIDQIKTFISKHLFVQQMCFEFPACVYVQNCFEGNNTFTMNISFNYYYFLDILSNLICIYLAECSVDPSMSKISFYRKLLSNFFLQLLCETALCFVILQNQICTGKQYLWTNIDENMKLKFKLSFRVLD